MNYNKIKSFSSDMRICNGFISLTLSVFIFVGVAAVYNCENRDQDYKEKIKELC